MYFKSPCSHDRTAMRSCSRNVISTAVLLLRHTQIAYFSHLFSCVRERTCDASCNNYSPNSPLPLPQLIHEIVGFCHVKLTKAWPGSWHHTFITAICIVHQRCQGVLQGLQCITAIFGNRPRFYFQVHGG